MNNYITRIELHYALEQDYQTLHNQMSQSGFSRTIMGDNGVAYMLPTATYSYQGSANIDDVYNAAANAANTTGKSSWILVSQTSKNQFWLTPAQ